MNHKPPHVDSQAGKILAHMRDHGSITPIEALNKYGCFRLGARVWDLKRVGHHIETENTAVNGKHFATYRLIANGQQLELF